jgi:hypothetical protein
MAFPSMSQLMSRVWDTRDDCISDLKKSGFKPETAKYRPSQHDTGKWYIEEIDPEASQEVPEQPTAPAPMRKARERGVTKPPKAKATMPDPQEALERSWPDPTTAKKWLATHPQPGLAVTHDPDRAVYCLRPVETSDPAQAEADANRVKGAAATDAFTTKFNAPRSRSAKAPEPTKTAAKAPAKPDKPDKPARTPGKSSDPSPDELPKGFDTWVIEQATRDTGVLRTEIKAKLGFERRWMNYLKELGKKSGYSVAMQRDGRFTRFLMKKA